MFIKLLVIALVNVFAGMVLGYYGLVQTFEKRAIINDCAFYNPETAQFTWMNEAQEE